MALVLRGDHNLNAIKAAKLPHVASPLVFADEARIKNELGVDVGSIGPMNLNITVIVDRAAAATVNFACGANKNDFHLTGVNWDDPAMKVSDVEDIRNVVVGDPSPDGKGSLEIKRGIEVGHIFQLGKKYFLLDAKIFQEGGFHLAPNSQHLIVNDEACSVIK